MSEGPKSRKNYSLEFKLEAVERSKKVGSSQTCKELSISSSTLHRWQNEQLESKKPSSKDQPSYEELAKENRRLKRELGYMEEINQVLKKSTAIFSSSHLKKDSK